MIRPHKKPGENSKPVGQRPPPPPAPPRPPKEAALLALARFRPSDVVLRTDALLARKLDGYSKPFPAVVATTTAAAK